MATDRVEKSCAVRIGRQTLLPCSELLLYSRQDPSTDARDDRDGFYFQRSFDLRGQCPRSLRMTGGRQVCVAASRMRRGRAAIKKTEPCCSVFFNVGYRPRRYPSAAGQFFLSVAALRSGSILFVGRRLPPRDDFLSAAAFSAAGQFFLSCSPHCGRRAAIISLAAFTPSTRAMTSVRSTGLPWRSRGTVGTK